MNTLNKINNQLITYAYNRAEEIKKEAKKIENNILINHLSTNKPNKPLNISYILARIERLVNQLKELEQLSTKVYRYNKGLDTTF